MFEIQGMVKELVSKQSNAKASPKRIQVSTEETKLTLIANPTNPQEPRSEPLVFINFAHHGRKQLFNIDKSHSYGHLLREGLKLFDVPPNEYKNYCIFDIRCRKSDWDDGVMGTQLRNIHTFNLVHKNLFTHNTAYELQLKEVVSIYQTSEFSSHSQEEPTSRHAEHTEESGRIRSMVVFPSDPPKSNQDQPKQIKNPSEKRAPGKQQHHLREREPNNRRTRSNTTRVDRHGYTYKTEY